MASNKVVLDNDVFRVTFAGISDSRNCPILEKFGVGQIVLYCAMSISSFILLAPLLNKLEKGVGRA